MQSDDPGIDAAAKVIYERYATESTDAGGTPGSVKRNTSKIKKLIEAQSAEIRQLRQIPSPPSSRTPAIRSGCR